MKRKWFLFSLIAIVCCFLFFLTTCSNPTGSDSDGMGTFTVSFSDTSRAANYPPSDVPGGLGSPLGPSLTELKFEVIFTNVVTAAVRTYTFDHGDAIKGSIAVGIYTVTMEVLYQADNSRYAQGVAQNNPIEITSGTNSNIPIKVYDPDDALPPVISVHPVGAGYDFADTVILSVTATSMDDGILTYEWFSHTGDDLSAGMSTSLASGPASSFTPTFSALGPHYYYVEITNTNVIAGVPKTASLKSRVATVSMDTAPVIVGDGSVDTPYLNLLAALGTINTTPGIYTVKIRENQNLAPYTFTNNGLTRDITLIAEPPDSTVTVKLSGSGFLFTLPSLLTLTLDAGITLRGRNAADDFADNTSAVVQIQNGIFNMEEGSLITGNTSSSGSSGGVYINSGTFNMRGGTIAGNRFTHPTLLSGGGGVNVTNGTFNMEGNSRIEDNHVDGPSLYGGGVFLANNGIFNMKGNSRIENNSTLIRAGGVAVFNSGAFFTMQESATISKNKALLDGGGVGVWSGCHFSMEGGEISWNTAGNGAGGVYITGGTFTKAPAVPGGTSGIITGYDDDPVNGNVVLDATNLPKPNQGHAVYVNGGPKREKTVGQLEELDWDGTTATGDWPDP